MTLFSNISNKLHSNRDQRGAIAAPEPETSSAPAIAPDYVEQTEIAQGSLDVIGRNNEDVRDHFLGIVRKSNEILALRDDVIAAADEVANILRQAEQANATLVEKSVMHALEEQAHNALKERHRRLQDENDGNARRVAALTLEIARHEELVQNRESRIGALETEVSTEKLAAAESRGELDRLRAETANLTEQLTAARAEIAKSDMLVGSMQIEAVALGSRLSTAEYHLKATQTSLAESESEAKSLRDSLTETEGRLGEYSTALRELDSDLQSRDAQIAAQQAKLDAAHAEHSELRAYWQSQADAHAAELAKFRHEVNELNSRADSLDALYAGASADLQTKTVDLRKAERRIDELLAKIGPLEERVRVAEHEMASLSTTNGEIAASYARVTNRSHALLRGMRDQKAKLDSSEQRARMLEERLASEAQQFDQVAKRLRATVQSLNEEVEKEKVARYVALGALEAARSRAHHEANIADNPDDGASDFAAVSAPTQEPDAETSPPQSRNRGDNSPASEARPASIGAATSIQEPQAQRAADRRPRPSSLRASRGEK
jgi:chromosome segregation ATPase